MQLWAAPSKEIVARPRSLPAEILAERGLIRLPTSERRGDIVGKGPQLGRQGESVRGSLGRAGRCVGPWDGGGISDEGNTALRHVVRSEIADCLGERLRRRLDHLAERHRNQGLRVVVEMRDPFVVQQAFGNCVAARMTIAIGHDFRKQAFIRDAVSDPVVKPVAWTDVVVLAGNEIAEDMGALVIGETEVTVKRLARSRRHRVFREQASPGEITGVGRLHGRPELLAHDRVSAVGADQKVARLSGSILELRGYRPRAKVLIDLQQRLRRAILLVAEGRLQGRIDERPRRLGLWGEVLGLDRSVGPKDGAVRGPYAELDGAKINGRTPEGLDHFGLKNDAAPAAVEIMRQALEDVGVPSDSEQEVAGEEPAERPADDQGAPFL